MFDKKKKTDFKICSCMVLYMYCEKFSFVFCAEYIDRFFQLVYRMNKKIKKIVLNR